MSNVFSGSSFKSGSSKSSKPKYSSPFSKSSSSSPFSSKSVKGSPFKGSLGTPSSNASFRRRSLYQQALAKNLVPKEKDLLDSLKTFGSGATEAVTDVLSMPQRTLGSLAAGKDITQPLFHPFAAEADKRDPSDLMHIKNPFLAFGADVIADPLNFVAPWKATTKFAKLEKDAPKVMEALGSIPIIGGDAKSLVHANTGVSGMFQEAPHARDVINGVDTAGDAVKNVPVLPEKMKSPLSEVTQAEVKHNTEQVALDSYAGAKHHLDKVDEATYKPVSVVDDGHYVYQNKKTGVVEVRTKPTPEKKFETLQDVHAARGTRYGSYNDAKDAHLMHNEAAQASRQKEFDLVKQNKHSQQVLKQLQKGKLDSRGIPANPVARKKWTTATTQIEVNNREITKLRKAAENEIGHAKAAQESMLGHKAYDELPDAVKNNEIDNIKQKDTEEAQKAADQYEAQQVAAADPVVAAKQEQLQSEVALASKAAETATQAEKTHHLFALGLPFARKNKDPIWSAYSFKEGAVKNMLERRALANKKGSKVALKALESRPSKAAGKLFNNNVGRHVGISAADKVLARLSDRDTEQIARHFNQRVKDLGITREGNRKINDFFAAASDTPFDMKAADNPLGKHTSKAMEQQRKIDDARLAELNKLRGTGPKPNFLSQKNFKEWKKLSSQEHRTLQDSLSAAAKHYESLSDNEKIYTKEIRKLLDDQAKIDIAHGLYESTRPNYISLPAVKGTGKDEQRALSDPAFAQSRSGNANFTEASQIDTHGNGNYDVLQQSLKRINASNKAVRQKIWADQIAVQYGKTADDLRAMSPEEAATYEKVDPKSARTLLTGLKGKYVPKDIYDDLDRVDQIYRDPEAWGEVTNTFKRLTRHYKSAVYTMTLGHFATDFIGNMTQLFIHDPAAFFQAAKPKHFELARKISKALNDPNVLKDPGAKLAKVLPNEIKIGHLDPIPRDDFIRMLYAHGAADSAFSAAEVGTNKGLTAIARGANRMQRAGNFNENLTRSAAFMGALAATPKGTSLNEALHVAGDTVNRSMFDYVHGLSDTEKNVFRSYIPFYSYMRFSIPLMAAESLKHPTLYGAYHKFQNNLMTDPETGNSRIDENILPDYLQGNLLIGGTPNQKSGLFLNPKVPTTALDLINTKSPVSGTAKNILGTFNPMLKAPWEIANGNQLNGMPINRSPLGYLDYGIRSMGGGYGSAAGNLGTSPALTGKGTDWQKLQDTSIGLFTGLKPNHINPTSLAAAKEIEMNAAKSALTKKLENEGLIKSTRKKKISDLVKGLPEG